MVAGRTVRVRMALGGALIACAAMGAAPAEADVAATAGRTTSVNNAARGQCTDGALQKWFQATGSYPAVTGNAKDWPATARAAGWTVIDEPQARSLVVFQPGVQGASGDGHVAWVNSTNGVTINITEMNNASYGGLGAWHTGDVKDVPGMSYILLP
ncbi:MAG TPA: CHAP domain-containing protein [Mycobacterium sp.]|nr:CHAP domain-containing protein [Mycobacterium sp.]